MWIRSQDKRRLVKCDFIRVNGNEIQANFSSNSYSVIAKYSSEEKALKVLDMIQEAIKGKSQTTYTETKTKVIEYYNNIESVVFQMPQDSEVKDND